MFLFGFNVFIILSALLGGSLNRIHNKKFSWWSLQSAFFYSLILPTTEEYYIYPIAIAVGFLSCKYMPRLSEYINKKMRAKINRKRWGKYIHKKN
tara:strand:- start:689 stop:973 length:285 start_codon:yes stop_codon:yes gene_type:complete